LPTALGGSGGLKVEILSGGGGITTVTATDKSGSVTSGGVAQTAIALNANRKGWSLQNTSVGNLYISITGTASTSSFLISPGASVGNMSGICSTGAISVYGATTGQTFAAVEYT
jgi:hypothetical protein